MSIYVCARCDRYADSDEGCIADGDMLICNDCECVDCAKAAALQDEDVCAACLAKREPAP